GASAARASPDLRRRGRLRPPARALSRHGRDPARARRLSNLHRRSVFVFGLIAIGLGLALLAETVAIGGGSTGYVLGVLFFALGIVALHALGLTPVVLGVVGVLFLVVTLSYAEGTTTIGEAGGAATFVRVAFNDLAGFVTGWALFLDYLIVIALSALFFPHYLGLALGWHSIAQRPGDVIVGCVLIGAIALVRLLRPTRLYSFSLAVPVVDLVTQLLLVILGFAF